MKHTEFPSISNASLTPVLSRPKPNSARGTFVHLVDALHGSRRLHAVRVIRQHRHLIHEEHGQHTGNAAATKSVEHRAPQIARGTEPDASKPKAAMSVRIKLLIAIAVAGFGILHAIAEGALRHAPASPPAEQSMPLPDRD